MPFRPKIILYVILAAAALPVVAIPWLSAQDLIDPLFFDKPREEQNVGPETAFPPPPPETLPPSPSSPMDSEADRGTNAFPGGNVFPEKKLAEIPEPGPKPFVDAGDFRDPFLLLPGYQEDSPKFLEPGTTVDGARFFSYSSGEKFIGKFYQESNFSLNDVFGRIVMQKGKGTCLTCHFGIEEIGKDHRFTCVKCHGGDNAAFAKSLAHQDMTANPSDLEHAPRFCGKCHADQIEKVSRSLMATAKGEINLTRYTWGAQSLGSTPFSLNPDDGEKLFPSDGGLPVDDFLRKKCLRCHLQAPAPHRPGEYRATGCAACHMIYANDGKTMTRDRAIQTEQRATARNNPNRFDLDFSANSLGNPRGYPVLHKFTVAVPSVQCEHCHHLNGPGSEFEGLFAKTARPKPSMKKVDGGQPVLYGAQHQFLLPDIHREKGMHCIDCHVASEIKANGKRQSTLHDALKIRCEDCHGTHSNPPDGFLLVEALPETQEVLKSTRLNPNLKNKIKPGNAILVTSQGVLMPHIKIEARQWVLISKVTGKKHKIPVLKHLPTPLAHQVSAHMNAVECSACHGRWSASEWGMHVVHEENPDPDAWRDWSFSDPTLQSLQFARPLKEQRSEPAPMGMLNWLTAKSDKNGILGEWTKGVWWTLFAQTDWSSLVLGKNARGKYSVMKPGWQYFITRRAGTETAAEKTAEVPITQDGRPGLMMVPHSPHTIRKTARPCEDCHGSSEAAGLGDPRRSQIANAGPFLRDLTLQRRVPPQFQLKQLQTPAGKALQIPLPKKNVRFLNRREIKNLEKTSDRYRAYRYLDLRKHGFPRLLTREDFPFDLNRRKKETFFNLPLQPERNTSAENPETEEDGIVEFSRDRGKP